MARNKKKFHKSSDGTKYGELWSRGDIIGCLLDFEQRRIIYYKNGKSLGVAFGSLRLSHVGMFPAVSVTYDGKVSVNLSKNLSHLPEGVFPMCPTATEAERKSLEEVFSLYESKNESGEDVIGGENLIRFATDLGSTGPLDPTPLILAWIHFSSRQWEFTKSEFLCSWSLQSVFSLDGIKSSVEKWRMLINGNEEVFRNFYQFVFEYLKQLKKRRILKKMKRLLRGKSSEWIKGGEFLISGKNFGREIQQKL